MGEELHYVAAVLVQALAPVELSKAVPLQRLLV